MVDFNPSLEAHEQLRDWLVKEQDAFIQAGETKDNNGRPFMRRERYASLQEAERNKYWTWDDDQCIDLMFSRAKQQMDLQLDQHNNAMQAYLHKTNGAPQKPVRPSHNIPPKPPSPSPRSRRPFCPSTFRRFTISRNVR